MPVDAEALNAWLVTLSGLVRRPELTPLDARDLRKRLDDLENCGPADAMEIAMILSGLDDLRMSIRLYCMPIANELATLSDAMYRAIYGGPVARVWHGEI